MVLLKVLFFGKSLLMTVTCQVSLHEALGFHHCCTLSDYFITKMKFQIRSSVSSSWEVGLDFISSCHLQCLQMLQLLLSCCPQFFNRLENQAPTIQHLFTWHWKRLAVLHPRNTGLSAVTTKGTQLSGAILQKLTEINLTLRVIHRDKRSSFSYSSSRKARKIGEKGLSLCEVEMFVKYQEQTAASELPCLDTRTNKRPLCFLQNTDAFSEKLCCHSQSSISNWDTWFAARSNFTEKNSPQSGYSSCSGPREELLSDVLLSLNSTWGRKWLEIISAWRWNILLEAGLQNIFSYSHKRCEVIYLFKTREIISLHKLFHSVKASLSLGNFAYRQQQDHYYFIPPGTEKGSNFTIHH